MRGSDTCVKIVARTHTNSFNAIKKTNNPYNFWLCVKDKWSNSSQRPRCMVLNTSTGRLSVLLSLWLFINKADITVVTVAMERRKNN